MLPALAPVQQALSPFPAVCAALDSATGLCTPFSCATAHAEPPCSGRLKVGSQEDPLTYRRGSAGSLVRSPGGHLGAASGVHLWRPGGWDRRAQWQPIVHSRLKPHSGKLVDGLRHAPARRSSSFLACIWYLYSPVCSALYTSSHRLGQHRPHLQLTCTHILTDSKAATVGADSSPSDPDSPQRASLFLLFPFPAQDLYKFSSTFPHTELMLSFRQHQLRHPC